MAISDDLPGVEVAITVNGNDLKEYRDPDLEEPLDTTTRYIEAISGQTFEVRIKVEKGFWFAGDALRFRVYADGDLCRTKLIEPRLCHNRSHNSSIIGRKENEHTLRRFQFASLEIVSDGRMLSGELERIRDIGTIQVRIRHVNLTRRIVPSTVDIKDAGMISEKALKGQALSHHVQFGAQENVRASDVWSSRAVPGFEGDLAVFVFKYRSMDALKIERVVPRTPTPQPLEEREAATISIDQVKGLQEQLKALKSKEADKVKIKRERVEEDQGDRPRRKRARPTADSTQLEQDEHGGFRQRSVTASAEEKEVIEID